MKIDRTIATALIALPFFVGTGSANATTWNIDAHHSEVGFKVRHMMISNVRGTFGTLEGTVEYDRAWMSRYRPGRSTPGRRSETNIFATPTSSTWRITR